MHIRTVALLALAAAFGSSAYASLDAQVAPPPAEIITTGAASVSLPADRVIVRLAVATRAPSASAASAPNGPAVARVQAALRSIGLGEEAVRVTSFGVAPVVNYQDANRITEYEARTQLEVTLRDIAALGRLMDSALAAGTNTIGALTFESDSVPVARRRALSDALASARNDAEALAAAAGGRLGALRLVTTTPEAGASSAFAVGRVEGAPLQAPAPTSVALVLRDVIVSVVVQARWDFVPRP